MLGRYRISSFELVKAMAGVSTTVIEAVATAVFKRGPSLVTEIYSAPGDNLQRFESADELCSYAESLRHVRGGTLFVGVQYPEMGGVVSTREYELTKGPDSGKPRSHAGGWGLIHVLLPVSRDASSTARIYVISERSALGRERGGVRFSPVRDWNWKAIESHARRLKRVLKEAV
ncbi:hypothetical protein [Stenotrophomonas sp. LMG 10879]|uniref:hypothetical protein n=1 Tax=Stenotrophomonas sp. LMG 10879 TaxID=487706 RepID=UPI001055C9CD|nr:hypothetical protein [Stenotrophomonas sp. LMG 10879]MBN5052017.1 hypothetical protein [Stenotrophomonas maltophilia]